MIIYPAIDLYGGKCVRLYQGNYKRKTVYSYDPLMVIEKFVANGAKWLHVVDLAAAENPEKSQLPLVTALIKASRARIQVGGGIRNQKQIENLLSFGVARVIVGSMAVQNRQVVTQWLKLFGADKLVLSLDVVYNQNKQPVVTTNGWQNITKYLLFDVLEYYATEGLLHVLCTNIMLDGTQNGPDYSLYEELLKRFPHLQLQASGGTKSLVDIRSLRTKGLSGVIIGRALYENKFTLAEALTC